MSDPYDYFEAIRCGSFNHNRNLSQFANPERIADLVSPGFVERCPGSKLGSPDSEFGELTINPIAGVLPRFSRNQLSIVSNGSP